MNTPAVGLLDVGVDLQGIPPGFSRFDSANYLKTEEEMQGYFQACVEEDPGDGSLVRFALGTIARARSMTQLSQQTGLSREGLYRALSPQGNPGFTTIMKVIHALGLKLGFHGNPSERSRPLSRHFNQAQHCGLAV